MIIKKLKKAFTLVELVVVIAVIAILSGVSVLTYTGVTTKAYYTNDISLVTEWNTILDTDEVLNGVPSDIIEVQDLFKENDTNESTFTPKSKNYHFYWCDVNNTIYLVDNSDNGFEVVNPIDSYSDSVTKDNSYQLDLKYCRLLIDENIAADITIDKKILIVGEDNVVEVSATDISKSYTSLTINLESYDISDSKISITPSTTDDLTIEAIQGGCFAAGTKITMADGSIKNVEDITDGESVLTFNHEEGIYEAQNVFFTFHEEYKLKPFTLHFDNGDSLSIVGEHDLFNQESHKYIKINQSTAEEFIGEHFYSVEDEKYIELVNVTYESEAVDFYTIYTECNVNCIANGMLTVPYENEDILNIYEINDDLTIDHAQLEADILTYGLFEYPTDAFYPKEYYDAFQMKYCNIMVGKGLITWDELLGRIAVGLEIDD